eukprot:11928-Heterococcus_DN1.PRE.1
MAEPWRSGYHTAAAFMPPEERSAAQPLQRNFTLTQLHCTPAALSLRSTVYDVSSTADVYGPEGTYSHLVGHDASIAIAKSFKDTADLDKFDLSSLSARENMTLNGWAELLEAKGCSTLGRLVQPPAPRPLRVRELAQHSACSYLCVPLYCVNTHQSKGAQPCPAGYAAAPMLMGCNNVVFDVSFGGQDLYGHGTPYNCLVGHDASRVLARMSMTPADINGSLDYTALTEKERKNLTDWEAKLRAKGYPVALELSMRYKSDHITAVAVTDSSSSVQIQCGACKLMHTTVQGWCCRCRA